LKGGVCGSYWGSGKEKRAGMPDRKKKRGGLNKKTDAKGQKKKKEKRSHTNIRPQLKKKDRGLQSTSGKFLAMRRVFM